MGDIEETKDWFLNSVWPEIVKSGKLEKSIKSSKNLCENDGEAFKVVDVTIKPIGLEEAFMMTKCYRVEVEYTFKGEKHHVHLVAKRTPTDITPENFEAVDFITLFHNELAAYTEIIPTLMKLSKKDENDYHCPIYYCSSIKENEASIVLGDFKEGSFQMSPSRINLSLEHILLGVEHIGFFHGLCFALKEIDKKKFYDLATLAKESRYAKDPPAEWESLNYITLNRLTQATDKFYPDIPKDFQDKIKKIISDCNNYSKKRVQPVEPCATLCHGDYLRNNIAFSYEDQENPIVPTKAMMFDFQTLRYSSPMVDLTTFLTITSGMDVRVPNFDKIFDAYHQTLASTYLEQTKGELPEFLSRSYMLKEYVRYLPYSLGIASFFLPNMHEPNNLFAENMLGDNFDIKKLEAGLMNLGGDPSDKELASLQRELYELSVKEDVDPFEGFL